MPLTDFTDERTDVFGATFDVDPEKFEGLCTKAALSPLVKITLALIDVTEDGPPHGAIRQDDDDVDKWDVVLPVSDRMEFSDKAVERVNRNLLHTLRHLAQAMHLKAFFTDDEIASGVFFMAGPPMETDAYLCERTIKEVPEARALTPKQIVLAKDPITTTKEDKS